MYMRKLLVLLSLGCISPVQSISVICEHDAINDTLDLDRIEPLSCTTYADLIPKEDAVLVARLVSSAHGTNHVHYVDAHLAHEVLFNSGKPSAQNAPKVLFNPVNTLPLVENITYFMVHNDHAVYAGTLTDVYKQTPAGEYIGAFLDAHHSSDVPERAYAQYALAQCYHTGSGVTQDMLTALYWYTKAGEYKTDAHLTHNLWYALGSVYENCPDIPDHAVNALTYYKKAAQEKTDIYAQGSALCALGNWYSAYIHDGVTAVDYYTQASKCTDELIQARAYTALGDIYRTGFAQLPRNYAQALTYYQHALTHAPDNALHAHIHYSMATLYYHGGSGLEKNYRKAAALFEQVARKNGAYLLPAALALGELYRVGNYGISTDARRAQEWYNVVLSSDNAYARMATFGLAELYREQDRVKALNMYNQLLTTCADGDCLQPMIYTGLASLYCFSCNQISADYPKATSYYMQAFNQTRNAQARAVAANGLATMYYHGTSDSVRDIPKAIEYFTYLTQQSDDLYLQAHAHHVLGELTLHGYGNVRSDLESALTHLQQAAHQKVNMQAHTKAQNLLHEIHEQSLSTASRAHQALQL